MLHRDELNWTALYYAVLGCSGLCWAALGCTGLAYVVQDCAGLCCARLDQAVLGWAESSMPVFLWVCYVAWGCVELYFGLGCVGLCSVFRLAWVQSSWTVLSCAELSCAGLGWAVFFSCCITSVVSSAIILRCI